MAISESQRKAVAKYNAKAYDEIKIRVYKGEKEKNKPHAEQNAESINGFVNRAIGEAMQREAQSYT